MPDMTIITDMNQIPAFKTEAEEADFWATHALDTSLMSAENGDDDLLPPVRPVKSNPVSLRLGVDLERRLRRLAELKGTTYQTLMKEFVLERVYEEEKRLHVI